MKKYLFSSFSSLCAFMASIAIFCGFIIEATILLVVNVLNKFLHVIFRSHAKKPTLQPIYARQGEQSI